MQEGERRDSRAAIADLVHRYALNIRTGRGADCAALFTGDGVFEIREADPADLAAARVRKTLTGRDLIRDYLAAAAGSGIVVCPLVHNLLIEVDGDEAQSSCIMTTRSWPSGHEVVGEYRDCYRYASGWLFRSRVFTIFRS
jgi:ketosteroid isomerase-like protein